MKKWLAFQKQMNNMNDCNCEIAIYEGQVGYLKSDKHMECVNAHSTAKLIQVLPVYMLGIDQKYSLSEQELAIMSASHLGQDIHIQVLKSLITKLGIDENQVRIPKVAPTGRLARRYWKLRHDQPSKFYHQCMGNHLALMAIQRELTGSVDEYTDFQSATQNFLLSVAQKIYALSHAPEMHRDYCGAPTYMVPLSNIAIAYKNLSNPSMYLPSEIGWAVKKNYKILKDNPLILEGDGCLSTVLTSSNGIIAKTGAGGLLAIGIQGLGCGIAIQSHQRNFMSVAKAAKRVLRFLGHRDEVLEEQLTVIANQKS